MSQEDLDKVNNLLERKKNYERCIKHLKPYTTQKYITNYETKKTELKTVRCFAHLDREETGVLEWGYLDEKAEARLLPVFEQLLAEVNQEIALVKIGGVPGKELEVKTMLSEEIQPMFQKPKEGESQKTVNSSAATKWIVALAIGFLLLLFLNIFG